MLLTVFKETLVLHNFTVLGAVDPVFKETLVLHNFIVLGAVDPVTCCV